MTNLTEKQKQIVKNVVFKNQREIDKLIAKLQEMKKEKVVG